MALPIAFIEEMRQIMPADELETFLRALTEGEQPVSIRLNPDKPQPREVGDEVSIPWCATGRYLNKRPQFTLDPALHAGAYYVQEASSQFVAHVVSTLHLPDAPVVLDLCAAPGGKSTAALSVLPKDSLLVSNEIDRKRARILSENIQKWGNPQVCVTANAPADFRPLTETFDLIICDVPCSGEGMFRKDPGAIDEWTPAKVRECTSLQRQIVQDIWDTLRPGGYLIYSTCTFNVHENEENIQFIHDALRGEIIPIPTEADWHIHPAFTCDQWPDIHSDSACRFMPHCTEGEGLFMALIHKPGEPTAQHPEKRPIDKRRPGGKKAATAIPAELSQWVTFPNTLCENGEGIFLAIPTPMLSLYERLKESRLYILSAGVELGQLKGKDIQPAHPLALSTGCSETVFPRIPLDLPTALDYLRREAITLPADTPRGYVLLTYQDLPLGFVKNIGNRCNSLYPTEWRIRNL